MYYLKLSIAPMCPVYSLPSSNYGQCSICQAVVTNYIIIKCNSSNFVDGSQGTGETEYQLMCLTSKQWDSSNSHSCTRKYNKNT